MANALLPEPEIVRKLLRYEPKTGKLFWLPRDPSMFLNGKRTAGHACNNWNSRFAGVEAMKVVDNKGYLKGALLGVEAKAHRVIWAIVHGVWPDQIDHINGIRNDNRIENLRNVTIAENNKNIRRSKRNSSGRIGVHFDKSCKRWRAFISVDGKRKHIGCFDTFQQADQARFRAQVNYGFHPNHGKDP